MFGIKTSLSKEWQHRFSNVVELNAYAEKQSIQLSDVKLKDIDVTGAKFIGANFKNTDWDNVRFFESEIKDSHFKGGDYRRAAFQRTVISNTIFENITFRRADFEAATLKNVKFLNCNFGGANFQYLESSDVVFEGAVLEEVAFYHAEIDVKYLKSKLTDVEMMGAKAKDHFVVKNSDIFEVNLENAVFPNVEITDSTLKKVTYHGAKAKKLLMKNLKGAMQSSGSNIEEVEVDNVTTEVLMLAGLNGKTVRISNVNVTDSLNLRAQADSIVIENSDIHEIWNDSSDVGSFTIKDSKLMAASTTSSKFGKLYFENVTIVEGANFEFTQADEIELHNVTKGPNFEFLGEGSNVKF